MKKLKNVANRVQRTSNTVLFIIILSVGTVLAGVYYGASAIHRYNYATDLSQTVAFRELIILGAERVKSDAPQDAQTGDIYLPPAKLFIPANPYLNTLTYSYDSLADGSEMLLVSDKYVFNETAAKLYSARNVDEVFNAVPKFQACIRGIQLTYNQVPQESNAVLRQTVRLNNGKDLFVYVEKECPELNETADLLTGIKAY